ncbi:small multi-drug export protein [Patescibacteria group bacterium]|nr:small multi-drug export protein [Patescibacteria group bacterium]
MDISWIYNIDPRLATFLLAMLPITELRASIPIALGNFGLPVYQAFYLSVIGNFIPAVLIVYFLGPISRWLRKVKIFDKFFVWLFARTRKRFDERYSLWGKISLLVFVAIPLPMTGVWTGSLAAWLFNIKKTDALIFIALGALVAGILVTLISLGAFSIFEFI